MGVIELLDRLISYPSISSMPVRPMAAELAQRCEDLGFRVEEYPNPGDPDKVNLVCTAGPDRPGGLLLSGHMDVVPVDGQPWSSDPFTLVERDGRLFGRGTTDMKGFIAACLQALEEQEPRRFNAPLVLAWTCDEEVGCLGSAALAQQLSSSTLPRSTWIGEPTDFQLLRMHAGHVAVHIHTRGKAAHSSMPDLGASALLAMGRVLVDLEAFSTELAKQKRLEEHLDRPYVTLNPGIVQGGTAINIVADRCELTLGYRPLPGDDPLEVHALIDERLARLALPAGTSVHTRLGQVTPSLLTPPGTPLESVLLAHADNPQVGAAPFATDGGNLSRLDLEPLVFGPGCIEVAHRADEYIEARALQRSVTMIRDVINRCCHGTAGSEEPDG